MDLINLLLPRQSSSNINQHKHEHKNPGRNLIDLPLEILELIRDYLSPNDTASLVLCNHALLRAFGNRHWASLRPGGDNNQYRESFLTTLSRDLPGHFFCHYCVRLHLRDDLGSPGPALNPENRWPCVSKAGESLRLCVCAHPIISWYRFTFHHLQLAMKRHHHGPGHGISTESLSFTEVEVSRDEDEADRVTTLLSVEARICPEPMSLCLRIQHWALVSSTMRDMIRSKTKFVTICDHITTHSSEISQLGESELKPRRTESEYRAGPDVSKCRFCNTDFQVEIKDFGDEGLALVVTKWLDLGSGLTPMDTRWRVHLGRDRDAEIGALGEAGIVRLRFESERGLTQDALSCQNASYLRQKRFMNAMDRWNDCTWFLQAGKRMPFSYHLDGSLFLLLAVLNLPIIPYAWWMFFRG
ncbi:MAG: hypothetical protein LQ347_004563 [Umbilicaria vellea]|nr:MAG: hypothetical protein LQ347_004563 [Umbilicaria vellea]